MVLRFELLIPDPPGRIVGGQEIFNSRNQLGLNESEMHSLKGGSSSMIFQEPIRSLNPVFRIGNLMREVIRLHHDVTRAEARDRSLEMLIADEPTAATEGVGAGPLAGLPLSGSMNLGRATKKAL